MPKAKKADAQPAATMGFPGVSMSEEMAKLVQEKIKEFEKSSAEANEKNHKEKQKESKAAAKSKLKEAKQLLASTEMTDAEKSQKLWERLEAEHKLAEPFSGEFLASLKEIDQADKDREESQAELQRALGVKGKLESLCKQLQQQTNALVEERRRLSEMERQRRQDLAEEFQRTIDNVKKTMDQQAQERTRLARENEELRSKFKKFFEEYDTREKERMEQQQVRDLEVQKFEVRLAEQAQLYRAQATKEAVATRENDELTSTEKALREQLQTYSTKFNHFQDSLSKSDKVLGQYKRQRNKMQRRVELLEKENVELKSKNDRKMQMLSKERESMLKEKDGLQERCKKLQQERQQLLEDVQKLGGGSS
eukprot:TRINITY_DN38323_c0_g1_i1.p1 TRINITY_DN38323_c0_g1~~TRINITY_DN38323_c0_g1_i1.p1  ORF type:complete len:391 (-),score=116.54 TRINITY_DN38323_c0_g1_i1:79-1176(-)